MFKHRFNQFFILPNLCARLCTSLCLVSFLGCLLGISLVHAEQTPSPKVIKPLTQAQLLQKKLAQKTVQRTKPVSLREEALKQLLEKAFPLTPEQIHILQKHHDDSKRAVATPVHPSPQPVSSTLKVDLSPGNRAPVIRLSAGFITSLVFVDSTGQSWPVADYSLGDPQSFNIQWDKKTNTLFVQSLKHYSTANMAVRLANLDTPIMISLVTGQKIVDYRVDLQVPGSGPNALPAQIGDSLDAHSSTMLLSVLDGVPPVNSVQLSLIGSEGQAWLTQQGTVVLRTKLTLLSPAWTSTVSSLDGTHVYEIMQTPLLLASTAEGKTVKIELKGF